jgi:hypothetical protein
MVAPPQVNYAADEVADRPVGCRMTWVAVMVDPLVHPSTRTGSALVTALAVVELFTFWYVVKAPSLTVTCWFPAVVVMVKLAVVTLLTAPAAPPGAGPDRALDPSPPDPEQLPELLLGLLLALLLGLAPGLAPELRGLADAEEDVARLTESPITAPASAAATIQPPLRFDTSRRVLGRRGCLSSGLAGL